MEIDNLKILICDYYFFISPHTITHTNIRYKISKNTQLNKKTYSS